LILTRRTYAGRAVGFARKQVAGIGQRLQDQISSSYLPGRAAAAPMLNYLKPASRRLLSASKAWLAAVASNYLAHRFDLLGSGWTQVRHGITCRGVERFRYESGAAIDADLEGKWLEGRINRANLAESQRIWKLVDPGYTPIDWHLDFKSGYRWPEDTWYLDIRYGHKPGVDIKVPWELARMQHLPQFAWAYASAVNGEQGLAPADVYLNEYRNEIFDFAATNPPRFGVNWRSAMEAAIRAANWVVAADLFRANGANFDATFENTLSRSLYEHGLHIEANFEWDPQVRGNHYLANIVGLLFIAAYLPRAPKTDAWLAFAVRQLVKEADFQFAPDGTHREASTSYHRLTAEMMAYATALVLGLPAEKRASLEHYDHRLMSCRPPLEPAPILLHTAAWREERTPFPSWYFERLERAGEFIAHITKPSGRVPQVGDNDSGRFLRLNGGRQQMTVGYARSRYANLTGYDGLPDEAPYWDEDHLDHRGAAAAMGALFNRCDLTALGGESSLEVQVIKDLTGDAGPISYRRGGAIACADSVHVGSADQILTLRQEVCAAGPSHSYDIPVAAKGDLCDGLVCCAYPDFGIYIFRSVRLYLAVRCGLVGSVGNGGHAHHDQLSIELSLDGRDLVVDPGTYLYSALKQRRNDYRSVRAHFAPQLQDREIQGTGPGLFEMRDRSDAKCLYFGPQGFAGSHCGYGVPIYRFIEIGPGTIRITDAVKGAHRLRELTLDLGFRGGWRESPPASPGYGIILCDNAPIGR
jgi:Heparinase II/III-like protein/Heparinase II/III N-terminus